MTSYCGYVVGVMRRMQSCAFNLDSQLKIGQFSFSEQDLALPVSGIPLTVVRTYNSMNPRSGDFGYGWSLALNSMDVSLDETRKTVTVGSSGAPLADETEDDDGLPLAINLRTGGGHNVTLTLPDGRRSTFVFDPLVSPYACKAYAKWKAPPGVLYGLTPIKTSGNSDEINLIPFRPPVWQDAGDNSNFDNYDVPGWILTNIDNTQYYITRGQRHDVMFLNKDSQIVNVVAYDAQPKLTKIVQPSGDHIDIGDTYVRHYDANETLTRSIFMERDDAGRNRGHSRSEFRQQWCGDDEICLQSGYRESHPGASAQRPKCRHPTRSSNTTTTIPTSRITSPPLKIRGVFRWPVMNTTTAAG